MAGVVVVNQIETLFTNERRELKWAEIYFDDVSVTTWKCLIDLDNQGGAGPYKHVGGDGYQLKIASIAGFLRKERSNDQWVSAFGVIKAIDGTQATVEAIIGGILSSKNTGEFFDRNNEVFFPALLDMTISGGDTVNVTSGLEITTTEINTGVTIEDARGNAITLAVGDIVSRVRKISGSGTCEAGYSVSYLVEE